MDHYPRGEVRGQVTQCGFQSFSTLALYPEGCPLPHHLLQSLSPLPLGSCPFLSQRGSSCVSETGLEDRLSQPWGLSTLPYEIPEERRTLYHKLVHIFIF